MISPSICQCLRSRCSWTKADLFPGTDAAPVKQSSLSAKQHIIAENAKTVRCPLQRPLVQITKRFQGVVLCADCYSKPAKSLHVEGHDPDTHDVLRTLLYFPAYLRQWVRQLAELYVRDVILLSFNSEESFCHKCEVPLKAGMPVGVCVGHLDTCAGVLYPNSLRGVCQLHF